MYILEKISDRGAAVPKNIAGFPVVIFIFVMRLYSTITLCISHPEKPLFLYWMLPDDWRTLRMHQIYIVFNALYVCAYWGTFFFNLIVTNLVVETSRAWIQLRCSGTQKSIQTEARSYLQLLVLNHIFENAYGKWTVPTLMSSCTAILTVSGFGVVRFWGRIGFRLYVSFLSPFVGFNSILTFLLLPAAFMKQESEGWKREMRKLFLRKTRGNRRHERALLRSLPTLGLRVGKFFTVETRTHVTVLGMVSVNAMSLLITL